jgi:hypothetical protein
VRNIPLVRNGMFRTLHLVHCRPDDECLTIETCCLNEYNIRLLVTRTLIKRLCLTVLSEYTRVLPNTTEWKALNNYFGNQENRVEQYFHFRSLRLLRDCAMCQAVCRRSSNIEARAQSQPDTYEIFWWAKNKFLSGCFNYLCQYNCTNVPHSLSYLFCT